MLILCIYAKAQSRLTQTLEFESLTAIDTINSGKMDNYPGQVPIIGNDVLLAKADGDYHLIQKHGPDSWVVYELPEELSDTAECEISGQFIIYYHLRGNSTKNTSWSSKEAVIIDAGKHGFLSIETDYELQEWGSPPTRKKNESYKQYSKRVNKELEVKYTTSCYGSVAIKDSILRVWRKCSINGANISPIVKPHNLDWQYLEDVGTYRYKNGVFYRVTTIAPSAKKRRAG